jgi:hypothetical protein
VGGLLTKIFGGPASDLVKSVGGVIDNLTTSDKEKLDARIALANIERQFNADLLVADSATVKEQAAVIKAEVESSSWMARNWRPILMLVITYILAHTYVLVPLFSLKPVVLAPEMWELLKLGVGGYVIGRSVEKTASSVLPVLQAKINTK